MLEHMFAQIFLFFFLIVLPRKYVGIYIFPPSHVLLIFIPPQFFIFLKAYIFENLLGHWFNLHQKGDSADKKGSTVF